MKFKVFSYKSISSTNDIAIDLIKKKRKKVLRTRHANREPRGDHAPDPGPSLADREQKGGHVPAPGPSPAR